MEFPMVVEVAEVAAERGWGGMVDLIVSGMSFA